MRQLLAETDVLIENFRPGTLEQWGLGWTELRALNSRLIMIRVSGYGQTGPYRDKTDFGAIGEAMSGFRYLSGEPGRAPVRVGISSGDALGGRPWLHRRDAGALPPRSTGCQRSRSTRGRGNLRIDVGVDGEAFQPEYEKLGQIRQPTVSALPGIAPSNVYPTADGQWVVIGANADNVFCALCRRAWSSRMGR